MESLFVFRWCINLNLKIEKCPYDWFCGPGSYIVLLFLVILLIKHDHWRKLRLLKLRHVVYSIIHIVDGSKSWTFQESTILRINKLELFFQVSWRDADEVTHAARSDAGHAEAADGLWDGGRPAEEGSGWMWRAEEEEDGSRAVSARLPEPLRETGGRLQDHRRQPSGGGGD